MSAQPTWAETRAAVLATLPGLSDTTLEIVRRAGAPARHEHRVARAVVAALKQTAAEGDVHQIVGGAGGRTLSEICEEIEAGDVTWLGSALVGYGRSTGHVSDAACRDHLCRAATLCAIGGADVDYTARPSAFRALGKGRRRATDGECWTAAICEAGRRLCEALGAGHPTPSGYYEPAPEDATDLLDYIPREDYPFVRDWLLGQLRRMALPTGFLEHDFDAVRRLDAAIRGLEECETEGETK